MTELIVCDHPEAMLRHLGRSLYGCLDCGHTSHLKDRQYFCNSCPDVHTKTFKELLAHYAEVHPSYKPID